MAEHPPDWHEGVGRAVADHARRALDYLDRNANRVIAIAAVIFAMFSTLAWCDSHRAVLIAQETLEATQKSIAATQRASVHFQGLQFNAAQNDGRPLRWHVVPVWENTGSTATRELTFEITCPRVSGRAGGDRERIDPYELRSTFAPLFMSSLLGPHQAQAGGACEITPEEMERVKDGRLALFIVAAAHYKDMLDESAAHETWQCMRIVELSGTFDSTEGPAPGYASLPCGGRANCADEGCKRAQK